MGIQAAPEVKFAIIREATRLGLGFSLTSGAHWATANLPDTYTWDGEKYTPDCKAAAKELDYATVLLKSGEADRKSVV